MTQLRFITLMIILVSCGSFEKHGSLLPLSKVESNEMLLTETEEAEYRYLADLYGLSDEKLDIKGDTNQKVVQTQKDWDLEQVNLNEIENSSFVINDYEVTFVEDKFKHEAQLVAEAKAEEAKQKSRGIASIQEVSILHKKRRPASLFAMAKKSTPESIRYYVKKKGADKLNEKNKQGDTPLHIAIKNKRYDNVKALLGLNANPNLPDASGKTVAQYAQEMGLKSILKRIQTK